MGDKSGIEWTDATWNPVAGCDLVSPGCTQCYAMRRVAPRLAANPATPHYRGTVKKAKPSGGKGRRPDRGETYVWTGRIGFAPARTFDAPLRWTRPRRIFVNSTSDLFHPGVPDDVVDRVFAVMALSPQHTFQVLTKRPERMADYVGGAPAHHSDAAERIGYRIFERVEERRRVPPHWPITASALIDGPTPDHPAVAWPRPDIWPLGNVLLGTSVEDQARADERSRALAEIASKGWHTFVSYEPALGPVDWSGWEFLGWLISGGESGHGARPSHPDWHRAARDWCSARGIPYLFKQWGEWKPLAGNDGFWPTHSHSAVRMSADGALTGNSWPFQRVGKKLAGRILDGSEHNGFPDFRGNRRERGE